MNNNNTSGPAYPFIHGEMGFVYPSMTLRDYFAGQALAGICANPKMMDGTFTAITPEELADKAFRRADGPGFGCRTQRKGVGDS